LNLYKLSNHNHIIIKWNRTKMTMLRPLCCQFLGKRYHIKSNWWMSMLKASVLTIWVSISIVIFYHLVYLPQKTQTSLIHINGLRDHKICYKKLLIMGKNYVFSVSVNEMCNKMITIMKWKFPITQTLISHKTFLIIFINF